MGEEVVDDIGEEAGAGQAVGERMVPGMPNFLQREREREYSLSLGPGLADVGGGA